MTKRNIDLNEAFFKASKSGNFKKVQKLIKDGVDVNTIDKAGWTALHFASARGHIDVIKVLINNRANLNIEAHGSRWTPLWLAKQNNREGDHQLVINLLVQFRGWAI